MEISVDVRCRLCAEYLATQVPVLEDINFITKLYELFRVKISLDDKLPKTVCQDCYDCVERSWQFNSQIQKAQEFLSELVHAVLSISNDIIDTSVNNTVTNVVEAPLIFEEVCKEDLKCEFTLEVQEDVILPKDSAAPETAVVEIKKKVPNNIKRKSKRNSKKTTYITDLEGLSSFQYEVTPDGDIKIDLEGWESFPWTCCDCRNIYTLSEDLRDHFATLHNSPPRYTCVDCSKMYSKYTTFISHIKIHRAKLKFCCDICFKWYPTVEQQEKHRNEHEDDRPHVCQTCGKKFRMQSALLVHCRSHLPAEEKNRFQCDQCPKRFGTKPNLMAHKRIHLGVREFTCDQCGKSFVQKGNLDNHLLTHTAARPYDCHSCGKTFKTLVRLRKHGSVHSGLKPHQCDVCGRQFRERGTLKEHHRIHTGAMPFTCEFCGKCFRFKGVLTTHRRQHTGERPYSCNECQHHFTNWPNYNKHMKRRHGINTSVNCRTRQDIPPTGMPHRNPPGTVLAPPQPVTVIDNFVEPSPTFYPVLNLYNVPEELLQQRV